MNKLSIANRIQLSFLAAIGMVLVIGFLAFYYINKLNTSLQQVVEEDIRLARLTEEIKNDTFETFKLERNFNTNPNDVSRQEALLANTQALLQKTKQTQALFQKEENVKRYQEIAKLLQEYITSLQALKDNPTPQTERQNLRGKLLRVSNLNRDVLQDRYKELEGHQIQVARLSSDAQRNMIIVVLLMLVFGLGLGFVAPSVVVTPFKKMVQAINEVRTGKLGVSIPVDADDEIGAIAKSLNTMIAELKDFDEMKIKRIAFEKRRFETLANMVDYGVMVLKREGVIEFINSQLYLLLKLDTKEIEGYRVEHTPLPQEIKDFLIETLRTKEKVDNFEISLKLKSKKGEPILVEVLVDTSMVRTHDGTIVNIIITFEEKATHIDKEFLARTMRKKEKEEEADPV